MKNILASFALAVPTLVMAQAAVLYQTQIEPADAPGSALSAALVSKLSAGDRVQLFSDPSRKAPPRLKLVLRTMPIDGVNKTVSVWEAIWLIDQGDDPTAFLNTFVGYTGIDKAGEMADLIVKGISEDVESILKRQRSK